jgi:hypothetical protein
MNFQIFAIQFSTSCLEGNLFDLERFDTFQERFNDSEKPQRPELDTCQISG